MMSNFCAGPQLHAEEHALRPGFLQVPVGSSQMPEVGGELQEPKQKEINESNAQNSPAEGRGEEQDEDINS
ncbi:hypothetical protein Celaphus_00002657 [Cervus elaphus hippelaphus]|uniref:Uncharacterized protein n=1 Tax=Cervus elaphus hippelaphus TaxID=46360 RepID=A0A212CGE7_CEREH|nr:hypothetical protein Celaphus_00002657 [Cervus elaphus hippelaphus]